MKTELKKITYGYAPLRPQHDPEPGSAHSDQDGKTACPGPGLLWKGGLKDENNFKEIADACLSGLRMSAGLKYRISGEISKMEEPQVKKKLSLSAAIALALVLVTGSLRPHRRLWPV